MQNAKRNKVERLKAREELDEKLSKLKQGTFIRKFEDAITSYVKQVQEKLASYLQTEEFRKKFFRWTEDDLPKTKGGQNFSKMETFSRCIEQRFEYTLQNWESKENVFSQAHLELKALFDRGFLEFEREIRDIDRILVGGDVEDYRPFEIRPGRMFSPVDSRMKKISCDDWRDFLASFDVRRPRCRSSFCTHPWGTGGWKASKGTTSKDQLLSDTKRLLSKVPRGFHHSQNPQLCPRQIQRGDESHCQHQEVSPAINHQIRATMQRPDKERR